MKHENGQQSRIIYLKPSRNRSTALVLEAIFGIFGILGAGWLYAGNVLAGLLLLVGFIAWNIVNITIITVTAGFGALCTLPVSLCIITLSVVLLAGSVRTQ